MNEIESFLDKAARSFGAAERLLADGDVDFAASRSYYGCFYVAEALLRRQGLSFSRHGQVIAQYGRLFAKTGRLDPRFHRLLDTAFSFRQPADYEALAVIDPAIVAEIIEDGLRFLEAARDYLARSSPDPDPLRDAGEAGDRIAFAGSENGGFMKAIRVHETGGPEVLRYEEVPDPQAGPGEAVVKVEAAGVNFIDVYHRTGLYKVAAGLPFTAGQEGAGVVESVGEGVTDVAPGDRVAWTGVQGSYAEKAKVPAARLVHLPDGVSTRQGAAAMLQGMTAHYLACSTYPLKPGDTCLVHAAAGGVGLLLCQIGKLRGARVFGTTSTEEKAKLAREAGADEVILYTEKDFAAEVRRLTGGKGVQVVYDSVGKTTFEKSLDSLAVRGMLVTFGQSSGSIPPFDPAILNAKGSLYLTRPSLFHYMATREELLARAGDILGWIASGKLRLRTEFEFPLSQTAEAHRALEGRKTTGKVLLIP